MTEDVARIKDNSANDPTSNCVFYKPQPKTPICANQRYSDDEDKGLLWTDKNFSIKKLYLGMWVSKLAILTCVF